MTTVLDHRAKKLRLLTSVPIILGIGVRNSRPCDVTDYYAALRDLKKQRSLTKEVQYFR